MWQTRALEDKVYFDKKKDIMNKKKNNKKKNECKKEKSCQTCHMCKLAVMCVRVCIQVCIYKTRSKTKSTLFFSSYLFVFLLCYVAEVIMMEIGINIYGYFSYSTFLLLLKFNNWTNTYTHTHARTHVCIHGNRKQTEPEREEKKHSEIKKI